MTENSLDQRRLELEEYRAKGEIDLANARLELERRQAGRFSGASVTLIGAVIAFLSASATAMIGGFFGLLSDEENNSANLELKREEVLGQLRAEELKAEAERRRLEIQQRFQIVVQATEGQSREVAAKNLIFFVEAGILEDPDGRIRTLAEDGQAPDIATLNPTFLPISQAKEIGSARDALREAALLSEHCNYANEFVSDFATGYECLSQLVPDLTRDEIEEIFESSRNLRAFAGILREPKLPLHWQTVLGIASVQTAENFSTGEKYAVALANLGPQKLSVIKEIRGATGLELVFSKLLAETPNSVIAADLEREAADSLVAKLRELGADAFVLNPE